jgi:hypothetical protein
MLQVLTCGVQVVVDILLTVMVTEPQRSGQSSFGAEQVGMLFTFLARQMARYEGDIVVDRRLFDTVLDHLANPDEKSHHEERQQVACT